MIPYDRKTEIVEERVEASLERSAKLVAIYKAQGGFLGDKEPPPDVRLNRYWLSITLPDGSIDAHDMALIMDEHTELKLRTGVDVDGPHSTVWLNYLRIPGMFTENAKDFVRLNQADVERRKKEGSNEVLPTPGTEPTLAANGEAFPSSAPPLVASSPPGGSGNGGYLPPQPGMMQ